MPRVLTQKAGKDYPDQGIKKGDTYYKWSFRYGGTFKSLKRPRPSQLTQGKAGTIYAVLEGLEDQCASEKSLLEDLVGTLQGGAEEVRAVGEEYNEADEAMGGHQGQNYERGEMCEELASAMDELADQFSDVSVGDDEEYADDDEALDALRDECASLEYNEV